MAQLERDIIRERVKAGLERARARGDSPGRLRVRECRRGAWPAHPGVDMTAPDRVPSPRRGRPWVLELVDQTAEQELDLDRLAAALVAVLRRFSERKASSQ